MTYAELKAHIETMDKEQLNQNVTVYLSNIDEMVPVNDIEYACKNDDVLDENHPFLTIDY